MRPWTPQNSINPRHRSRLPINNFGLPSSNGRGNPRPFCFDRVVSAGVPHPHYGSLYVPELERLANWAVRKLLKTLEALSGYQQKRFSVAENQKLVGGNATQEF